MGARHQARSPAILQSQPGEQIFIHSISFKFFFFFFFWLLRVLVAACGIFRCGAWAKLPRGMWDLSSPTRAVTRVPLHWKADSNHWTTREVPSFKFLSRCHMLTVKKENSDPLSSFVQMGHLCTLSTLRFSRPT